jgi:hypothetical protein
MSYGQLHESFWTDIKVKRLSPNEKLLMLWFILGPQKHFSGLYHVDLELASKQTGISKSAILRGVNALSDQGMIVYDSANEVIWVKNLVKWFLYNLGDGKGFSENHRKGIAKQLRLFDSSPLIKDFLEYYSYLNISFISPSETPSKPLPRGHDTPPKQVKVKVKEKEKEKVKGSVKLPKDLLDFLKTKAKDDCPQCGGNGWYEGPASGNELQCQCTKGQRAEPDNDPIARVMTN